MLKFDEIKGNNIKKVLNAQQVAQQYHNRNKSGGNFGINIAMQNGDRFSMNGIYDTQKVIRRLSVAEGWGIGEKVIREDNYQTFTFEDLSRVLKEKIGKDIQPAKIVVGDRDKGAIVKDINGIKFVNFAHNSRLPDTNEFEKKAEEIVREKSEKLKSAGFKRVEFDTIGGYYYRKINKARFIPVSTMHSLRLMKR